MSEWKEYKLGEIITIKYGKDHKHLKDGSFPVYGSGGIMRYVEKYLYDKESILIPRKGSLSNIFYKDSAFWTVDTMFWTEIDSTKVFPKFLYYQMTLIDLEILNVGSAVPSLTISVINDIPISFPSLSEQKRIASILSSLDDKIDLLHRENKTLEAMAETLFRQWFIEEAKEDWKEGKLGDLIDVKYGKDHKKLLDGKIPVLGSGGIMRYADTSLYDKESVLIPRKGSLNNVMYINEPFWTVDTMFYTEMRQLNVAKFVYHFMKNQDLANMNVGSAVPSMTVEVLNNIPIDIPPQNIFDKFEGAVSLLYSKKEHNNKQIQTLTQTRNGLLPKLMSGEIKV
ncbi:MAG: restriction endonuclease subunit S [Bacteroidales bacterium]|nr:restriction endonuclease subunit S [Bacteroidales bacterium]